MAKSGSFDTIVTSGTYATFEWDIASQDPTENKSVINWRLYLRQNSGLKITISALRASIDGKSVINAAGGSTSPGLYSSGQATIEHNEDGTKSILVSVNGSLRVTGSSSTLIITGTQSFTLDTIIGSSVIDSAANTVLGNKCSVKWVPASAKNKFKIKFAMGSWNHTTGFITPGINTNYTYTGYTIPYEAAGQIPNSKTGTMSAELFTYNSAGIQIGESSAKTFTVTVPESLGPVAKMAVSALNNLVLYSLDDIYIQGRSKAQISFEGSSAQYGASIKSCAFSLDGKNYSINSAGSVDSDTIISSGTIEIKGTVTDSRGYYASVSQTINVLAYATPSVIPYSGNMVVVKRENKTELRIEAGKKYSSLEGNNLCSLSYRYAKSGASFPSEWTEILSEDSAQNAISFVAAGVTLDEKSSYTVELKAEDLLGEKGISSFAVSTEGIDFQLKKGRAAFGKYAEEDGFDVAWDAKFRGRINGAVINTFYLSTTELNLTITAEKQSVLIFGPGVFGVLDYDGTSTTWNGTGNVSCSTSGKNISATLPASGSYVLISNNLFS